ncbi:hypothetical protein, partial [Burkholderia pseudomallei]|uniref:hypothetical protein n=1 Tax=Burkholderia pseudomallei TaxID=28450 RepID=UPI001E2ACD76
DHAARRSVTSAARGVTLNREDSCRSRWFSVPRPRRLIPYLTIQSFSFPILQKRFIQSNPTHILIGWNNGPALSKNHIIPLPFQRNRTGARHHFQFAIIE